MTYKELPDYCKNHMCACYVNHPKPSCKYQSLCTRFVRKYGGTEGICPNEAKNKGLLPKEFYE